jgi:hypothetical protein
MRDGLSGMFGDYTTFGLRGGKNLVLRTILGAQQALES